MDKKNEAYLELLSTLGYPPVSRSGCGGTMGDEDLEKLKQEAEKTGQKLSYRGEGKIELVPNKKSGKKISFWHTQPTNLVQTIAKDLSDVE